MPVKLNNDIWDSHNGVGRSNPAMIALFPTWSTVHSNNWYRWSDVGWWNDGLSRAHVGMMVSISRSGGRDNVFFSCVDFQGCSSDDVFCITINCRTYTVIHHPMNSAPQWNNSSLTTSTVQNSLIFWDPIEHVFQTLYTSFQNIPLCVCWDWCSLCTEALFQ